MLLRAEHRARLRASVLALLFGMTLLAGASLAPRRADAEGLSLAWHDCRAPGGGGFALQSFGCTSDIVTLPLFAGFSLDTPVDSVIAMELVLDVAVAAETLPAWWRMEPGQCRAGGWAADASLAGSCADAWAGDGTAAAQGWLPGTPGATSNHGRLLVAAVVAPGGLVSLDADTPYTACRILLRTTGTSLCPGCSVPACLVLNSILIRRQPGASLEEVLLGVAESPGSTMVTWQGDDVANCLAVPARRTTWGAVKALYR